VPLDKIIYLEETGEHLPDLAFLQLAKRPHLPPPVPLWTERIDTGRGVVVIGYPARDSRNEPDAVTQVFGDIYDVKRLAPGLITGAPRKDWFFTHDCSTLGGNSGSLVADIETGRAVGLHFGGRFGEANFAVRANVLLDALARQQLSVPASKPAGPPPAKVPPEKKVTPTAYADRTGYDPEFLGTASGLIVPLPSPGAWASDLAPVTGAPTEAKHVLSYRHFSVALSKRRRLPIFTAVNIEGSQLRFLPRQGERWALDPRVSAKYQAGAELYANNDLDRGHMVRRLDPCWGTPEEAAQANEDTFHYANACPQHAEMNQGNWNDLENYLLDNAHAQALRVSVFTGPVLADDDRPYRGVRLPREYWKVAVWVDSASGKLAATGYMLSQADLVKNLEEFAYGPFRTYQVPIARIAQATKLDFGALGDHDPMATLPELAAQAAIPIVRSSDLRVR